MQRRIITVFFLALALPLCAQETETAGSSAASETNETNETSATPGINDENIPDSIRNNRYFRESLRYGNLARLAMSEADYDAVEEYAAEAVKWAERSDQYVRAFLESRKPGLPAQYTVRTWKGERDCLWNIAGQPWVYNNPRRWRILYEANKDKFPDPANPNWLEPGIVLDIPSIKGESRRGMWSAARQYETFR
jgi:nucleoid-associated protein YgaU